MVKKNTIKKLVSFESNGKDFSSLNKHILDGWHIVETIPHPKKKNVYFCVLEKEIADGKTEHKELNVEDIIKIVNSTKLKYNNIDKKISENYNNYKREKIFEDS